MTARMLTIAVACLVATIGRRAAASDDLSVVRTWLASSTKGAEVFEAATAFPFAYRTTNKVKKCERVAPDRASFSKWSACFRKDQKLLLDEIKAGALVQESPPKDAGSPGLQVIRKAMSGDGRWVQAFMNGDGVTYEFFFRVVGERDGARVNALILDEEVESD